ncbi:MAG: L-2-amino-thiazoline-4-carboxylic acid hydrolase [Chitinophagaceae bacterium]|nr:L-2-amino-thiazoline-4-carboxylic acid hydrolase [Chitinophagaceae bacterium]
MDNYHWIEQGVFDHLQTEKIFTDQVLDKFKACYKKKFETALKKVEHLVKNELDKGNVYFVLIAVSAYETFLEHDIPKDRSILLTDDCINKPLRSTLIDGTKKLLDQAENPFQTLVQVSKERENNYFGSSFEFERPVDNQFGYILHIKKCLFHETLKALNRQELQHLLCKMDLGWINGIDPDKHDTQFVRPVTFATGDTCQMWFIKTEHL